MTEATKTGQQKAAPKSKAKPKTVAYAATRDTVPFVIRIDSEHVRPVRGKEGIPTWMIPSELEDKFKKHTFVVTGRIVKVK